jgi:alpha-glucosidase
MININFKAKMLSAMIASLPMLVIGGSLTVKMSPDELWWGAANYYGSAMPFSANTSIEIDLRRDGRSNQYASLLLSTKGRAIWCEEQALFKIKKGKIDVVSDKGKIEILDTKKSLRDAYLAASKKWFPPSGKTPDLLFFSAPQYNTWIELTYNQNEKDILSYAKSMIDNGLPPGVLMIDDTWQAGYGDWRFEPSRFSDPKGMMDKLHKMGYKVILWMCPFVGMDTPSFRRIERGIEPLTGRGLKERGGFLRNKNGKGPACVSWWNGYSALLDFTHPFARKWFKGECDRLVKEYGADGFKFDGGHLPFYAQGYKTYNQKATSGEQVLGYASFVTNYPVCEYRNAWRFQGLPVVERLHDKHHRWGDLRKLIPDMIAGGLLGHPFMCPDMIGGGEWNSFRPGAKIDQNLFVRSAQLHALSPMMQFSASPWRVLDKERQEIVRNVVKLRQRFAPRFVELAKECGKTGEPMLRSLEYNYPNMGYATIKDQFMMGDFLLVAPQVQNKATERKVVIPPGRWKGDDGAVVVGPKEITVQTPLSRLVYFTKE